jgi:hypothetical protein
LFGKFNIGCSCKYFVASHSSKSFKKQVRGKF